MSCKHPIATARRAWILALGIACGTYPARLDAAPSYVFHTWQAEDGLPQNAVTAVVQTRDGYIWVGTYSGLARFDGVRFMSFYDGNTPEMHSSRVTCLFEAEDGTLWIGHEGGEVTSFKDGRFQAVPSQANWSSRAILSIGADEVGDLWLVSPEGLLSRLKDGLALTPRVGGTRGMVNVARAARAIWVARNGFVSTVQRGELAQLELDGSNETYVQGICPSRDGSVWIASGGLVRKRDRQEWTQNWGEPPWGIAPSTALIEAHSGLLAAGTQDRGLFLLFPNGETVQFSRTNGLPSDWVRSLCEDREGNLWVGTASGLAMLRASSVKTVSPPDQWRARPVLTVCTGRDGALWAGTEGAGLYRLQQGQWSHWGSEAGLSSLFVWSVAEDAQGRLWAGTWGSGVFVQQGGQFVGAPGLELKVPSLALLHDPDGDLWVGTRTGLLRYRDGVSILVGGPEGFVLPDVRAVVKDRDGVVWFGMLGGGLGRLQDGKLRQFHKADGLSSDFIQCLRTEVDGSLWIGTFGGGLNRLKDGRFAAIRKSHGLADDFICWIEEDGQGHFWMSSHAGIMRVSKRELNRCADGESGSVRCLAYGKDDGLPTQECSGGLQPAGCRTPDGRLWFATSKGLAVVDPSQIRTNLLAPPVVIEELRVDGQIVFPGTHSDTPLLVAPGRHRFDFDFTGLSFVAPDKVRFQYRLEGLDGEWLETDGKRSVSLSYVAPGSYDFHVVACNNDGVWNREGAAVKFTVLPYFWQTLWFRVLGGVMTAVGGGGIVWLDARRRMRRKLERVQRQHAIERERIRIAQDIHDDLGATLTRITMLSDPLRNQLDGPEKAAANLGRIHQTSRQLTRAMDEIVWAVSPKHDTLESLASYLEKFALDFLQPAGIRCRLDVPLQLPAWPLSAEVRHNLFLAFKEALHNVLKHAAATEVRISLQTAARSFSFVVEDNGKGFVPPNPGAVPSPGANRFVWGNGLANIQHRLEEIGGHFQIESTPAKGTRITLQVPVKPQES